MAPRNERPLPMLLLFGIAMVFIACVLIVIAFCSPNWLEKDKRIPNEFTKIGLWEVCFNGYRHPKYQYDRVFTGCRWIFHRDMKIIREYIEPAWFVAVQTFCTFGFITVIAAACLCVLFILQMCGGRQLLLLHLVQAATLIVSCFCNGIAVIIFAVRGDDRDWMPSPHFNHYSWSFAFAVTGTMAEFAAALFFGTLAMRNNREHNMRSERMQRPPNGVHQAPPARGQYPTKQPQLQPQPTRTQPPGPGYPHTITKSASKEDTV